LLGCGNPTALAQLQGNASSAQAHQVGAMVEPLAQLAAELIV